MESAGEVCPGETAVSGQVGKVVRAGGIAPIENPLAGQIPEVPQIAVGSLARRRSRSLGKKAKVMEVAVECIATFVTGPPLKNAVLEILRKRLRLLSERGRDGDSERGSETSDAECASHGVSGVWDLRGNGTQYQVPFEVFPVPGWTYGRCLRLAHRPAKEVVCCRWLFRKRAWRWRNRIA